MSWFTFRRDTTVLHGWDGGKGTPVIFQHGLGGDEAQVAEVFPYGDDHRRLTLECRAQGRSDAGDLDRLSIEQFAYDTLAFADSRGVDRFVAGGISMGAAIALRLAVQVPDRVIALILARPAWIWDAAPRNMRVFAEVADYLRASDPVNALARFESSATAQRLAREAPDNLVSLRKFFAAKNREPTASLLAAIAADGPGISEADVRAIRVPTLLLANGIDAVHPLGHARTLAAAIPSSRLVEIAPKATDKPRHIAEFRAAVARFLSEISCPEGCLQ